MKRLTPLLLACLIIVGCVGASHDRQTIEYRPQPDGTTNVVKTTEHTGMHSWLSTTALKGFSEITKDGTNGYSRSVRVTDTSTDISAQVGTIVDAAVTAAVSAAAKGVKP